MPVVERLTQVLSDYMRFAQENRDLYQLMFQRPVPGFVPSPESYAVSLNMLAVSCGDGTESGDIKYNVDSAGLSSNLHAKGSWRKMNRSWRTSKWLSVGLGALQVFIALSGLAGGYGLMADPSGANLGWTVEPLSESPFTDYLVPGIVLFVVIGAGNLLGSAASFFKYRYAGELGVGLGVFMMVWIAIQVWWIGLLFWLQPFFFAIGTLEAVLGILLRRAVVYQSIAD